MRVILVPVANRPECKVALGQAFDLATRLSASIVGCHLRPHRSEPRRSSKDPVSLNFGNGGGKPSTTSKGAQMRSKAAHKLFVRQAEAHDFRVMDRPKRGVEHAAVWYERVGSLDKLFPIIGPVADLSVVSRPEKSAKGQGRDFVLSAVMHSGKPVLILPQKNVRHVGRRVLIAWNQSIDAARAVSASMPLLTTAEAVHICSCGLRDRAGPKASHLARYLAMWGVKTTRSVTKGSDVAKELRTIFHETKSDLMVMGAYSRGRLQEIVFGGVTRHMLFETTFPVLALHS